MDAWIYKGKEFSDEMIFDNYGFVYIITNKTNGKKYIGKKYFYSTKYKQVNKKKKRIKVYSDWKSYFGSNEHIKEEVKTFGYANFKREIIRLCKTKGECSYFEAKEQFDRDVLLDDNYYNGIINCRINKSHLKNLNKQDLS